MSFNQFDLFYVGCRFVPLFDLLNISSSSGPFHSGGWAEEHVEEIGKMIAELDIFKMMHIHRRVMLEEGTLRKMKALLATSNRLPPWSSVVNQYSHDQVKSGVSGIKTLNSWFVLWESEFRKDFFNTVCWSTTPNARTHPTLHFLP